jgi:5-methyltetrahydropteroyltriglutamate--homocysteine methyltransferase
MRRPVPQLLPTSVVGSYPQPAWLVDRDKLKSRMPPRVRARELWRVPEENLQEAQDDATLLAVRDMERAGIDIITDGEIRRESYSNHFATALEGIDIDSPGSVLGRTGNSTPVPRVVGPIRRARPIQVRDTEFLRANTDRAIKITLPGPFTMAQQAQNEYYDDEESLAIAYADAVNEEVHALFAAGADIVQLDEPWMQSRHEKAKKFAVETIARALDGVTGETAVHMCFGYAAVVHEKPSGYSFLPELETCCANQISIEAAEPGLDVSVVETLPSKKIMLGVISMGDPDIETPEMVADRIRVALNHAPADRLIVAPDCGMKYLSRDVAFGKLSAMVEGAAIVRAELGE